MAESSLPGEEKAHQPLATQQKRRSRHRPPGPAGSPPHYLSLVHLMAGTGSPTELHGSLTSFIHGVVTVPPKEMILAGAWGQGGGQPGKQAPSADPPDRQ